MIKSFRVPGLLAVRLEELGVPVPAVLRRARLPADLFQQARILVSTEEFFALWRAIGEVSKDPLIGVKLGSEERVERFHPVCIAALSTNSFGAAVTHMARYKKLCAPEEILHEKANGEYRIQFKWTLASENEPAVLVDSCFAWVLTIARGGTGKHLTPLRLELVQPRADIKAMQRFFGCEVVSGCACNTVVFRESDADLPFVTRNDELLDMLMPQFDLELKAHDDTSDSPNASFVELVRSAIQQRLTGQRPIVDDIARDLHLSPRTLQRRLQDSGSSFQKVLDEARRHMARYFLRNSVLELSEAAYLLGYEDANSFTRAFRGWEGVPPTHWRDANRV